MCSDDHNASGGVEYPGLCLTVEQCSSLCQSEKIIPSCVTKRHCRLCTSFLWFVPPSRCRYSSAFVGSLTSEELRTVDIFVKFICFMLCESLFHSAHLWAYDGAFGALYLCRVLSSRRAPCEVCCDLLGRKINFTNSKTLVGAAADRKDCVTLPVTPKKKKKKEQIKNIKKTKSQIQKKEKRETKT